MTNEDLTLHLPPPVAGGILERVRLLFRGGELKARRLSPAIRRRRRLEPPPDVQVRNDAAGIVLEVVDQGADPDPGLTDDTVASIESDGSVLGIVQKTRHPHEYVADVSTVSGWLPAERMGEGPHPEKRVRQPFAEAVRVLNAAIWRTVRPVGAYMSPAEDRRVETAVERDRSAFFGR